MTRIRDGIEKRLKRTRASVEKYRIGGAYYVEMGSRQIDNCERVVWYGRAQSLHGSPVMVD